MKNISFLLIGLSLLMQLKSAYCQTRSGNPQEVSTSNSGTKEVVLNCPPELYPLAIDWVEGFNKSNGSMKINLDQASNAKPQSAEGLSIVSDQSETVGNTNSGWRMVIGRDIIVPIVNARNPMITQLNQQGISAEKFSLLIRESDKRNWSLLVSAAQSAKINLYIPNNEDIKSCLSEFVGSIPISSKEEAEMPSAEVINEVKSDLKAIGFCKLSDLRTDISKTGGDGIALLPIDKNGNGRLDNFEKIYSNLDEFTHGVWIGKYPGALCKSIYAASKVKPTGAVELAFLSWILTNGQNQLNPNGYCDLTSSEKQSNIASLVGTSSGDVREISTAASPQSWPVLLSVILLVGLFAVIYAYSRKTVPSGDSGQAIHIAPLLIKNSIEVPKGLYFDKTHTWAFMEKDGNVKVGMDDFLQHVTGKLTKVRMKEAGEKVRKGEKIVTIIRDGKQLNLYAPISGTIISQNNAVAKDSTLINSSPFSEGWVYLIEPKNWLREVQFMFMGEKYTEWLQEEFVRLKDFVSVAIKADRMAFERVVMQDGGELADNVLADLEPEIWEDFQTQFIDVSK
jgi:glycine cleavage system H lipoate-binding protein/ABC-type phosphate transport system substrate-binding protein